MVLREEMEKGTFEHGFLNKIVTLQRQADNVLFGHRYRH